MLSFKPMNHHLPALFFALFTAFLSNVLKTDNQSFFFLMII